MCTDGHHRRRSFLGPVAAGAVSGLRVVVRRTGGEDGGQLGALGQAPGSQRRASLQSCDKDGLTLEETIAAAGRPDEDPVAKTIAREQLQSILERARMLSPFERRCLTLSANGFSHREIAARLGVRTRAVNNALQRARHKVFGRRTR
jgi:DNA-directed RNA polymerase specialized sigma24 family protein